MTRLYAVPASYDSAALRPPPADYLDRDYSLGGEEVRGELTDMIQWFWAREQGLQDDRLTETVLQRIREFARSNRDPETTPLATELEQVAVRFQAVFESPLDMDAVTVQTLWDGLWPWLDRLAEGSEAESTENKGPTLSVRLADLENLARDVSHLSVTAELFDGFHRRLAGRGQQDALAEELRQIASQIKAQSSSLEKGILAARRTAIRPLLRQTARDARQVAAQKKLALDIQIVDANVEIDKVRVDDLEQALDLMVQWLLSGNIENVFSMSSVKWSHVLPLQIKASQTPKAISVAMRLGEGEPADENNLLTRAREILERHQGRLSLTVDQEGGVEISATIPRVQTVQAVHGLMLRHGGQYFLIPLDSIVEVTMLAPSALKKVHGSPVAVLRGETYRAVSLCALFDMPSVEISPEGTWTAVFVQSPMGKACFLAEAMQDHRRVIVSDFPEIVASAPTIVGAAPIEEGRLALVIDVEQSIHSLGPGKR